MNGEGGGEGAVMLCRLELKNSGVTVALLSGGPGGPRAEGVTQSSHCPVVSLQVVGDQYCLNLN